MDKLVCAVAISTKDREEPSSLFGVMCLNLLSC